MAKFKVGDKVRVVRSVLPGAYYAQHIGRVYTISRCEESWSRRGESIYAMVESGAPAWYDSELELVEKENVNMKKEFTKKDLKNGDVVKCRTGKVGIVCIDMEVIVLKEGCLKLSMFDEYLKDSQIAIGGDYTIMAIRRPLMPAQCQFSAFDRKMGTLVYERKEVEEMTLEEVCKALGKEIKIVKEKN